MTDIIAMVFQSDLSYLDSRRRDRLTRQYLDYVEARSENVPAEFVRFLVREARVATKKEVRAMLLSGRILNLAFFEKVPLAQQRYVDGQTSQMGEDAVLRGPLWAKKVAPILKRARTERACEAFTSAASDRLAIAHELDQRDDAAVIANRIALRLKDKIQANEEERSFLNTGIFKFTLGSGLVSQVYARWLFGAWLDNTLPRLATEVQDNPMAALWSPLRTLYPVEWQVIKATTQRWEDERHGKSERKRSRARQCLATAKSHLREVVRAERARIVEMFVAHPGKYFTMSAAVVRLPHAAAA